MRHQCQNENDTISPTRYIFGSPGGTPGAIATKMEGAAFGTDLLRSCVKFKPNPLRTDKQTNSKLNIHHYDG